MPELAERKYPSLLIILLCSLILLVVMQPWNLYFLNDDFEHIPLLNNSLVIRKHFLRPVSNLALLFDNFFYDKWATGYFITTWLLHTGCAISVYFAARRTIEQFVPDLPVYTALCTSLFFLFYPFHAEPLFWIIARGSVIAALFSILSIYYYLKKNENNKYLLISLLLFIVALLSYESIWNIVLFYCFISFLNVQKRASKKREFLHAGIFLLTFFAYLFVRSYALTTITGDYAEINNNIFNLRLLLLNIIKLTARNFTPPFHYTVFSVIFFSLSVILYSLSIVLMFKKNKSIAWLMVVLWTGIFSGVITAAPLGIDTHGNESERYIYYSSFFFCFFLAITTTLFRKKWQFIINSFIIVSCIYGLIIYNRHYRYSSAVTKTTLGFVKKYPNYKNAYFINVPGEYKGALIFRVCLPNAIRWIAPGCKFESVTIISKTEDAMGKLPYQTGEKTWTALSREKGLPAQRNNYILKDSLNRDIILNKKDVVFWFTPQGLYKMNMP